MLTRKQITSSIFMAVFGLLTLAAGSALAVSSYLNSFNSTYGTSGTPLNSCSLCHPSVPSLNGYGNDYANGHNFINIQALDSDGDGFVNLDEINARTFPGNAASFPATLPVCTDNDGDGFSVEGGTCGAVDCDDSNAQVNPNAQELCTDGIDNNCNGQIDTQDPNAVGCPPVCTDNDNDGFAIEGGNCGQVDCNDNNAAVNPAAAENCTDGIDNNCDGQIDAADPNAVNCPVDPPPVTTCTDNDSDGYAVEGGDCGAVDCDDTDPAVNPVADELCTDGIDNNCDGLIDSADPTALGCPANCTDADLDGFAVEGGECGPADCNDADQNINPAAAEECTDGIDNNCNDLIDAADPAVVNCPVPCTDNDGDGFAIEGGACGPVDPNDNDATVVPLSDKEKKKLEREQRKQERDQLKAEKKLQQTIGRLEHKEAQLQAQIAKAEAKLQQQGDRGKKTERTVATIDKIKQRLYDVQVELADLTGGQPPVPPAPTPDPTPAPTPDPGPAPTPDPGPAPVDGVQLYQNNCAACHGNLASSDVKNRTAGQINAAITANLGGMSYLGSLSSTEVQAIAAALGGSPTPTPDPGPTPTPDPGPAPGPLDGAQLYQNNCASCHRSLGSTNVPGRSANQIKSAISGNRGGMGYLGSLTNEELQAISDALAAPAPDPGPTPTPDPQPQTGEQLYANNCASCHGTLSRSEVGGKSARSTREAINKNKGGMGFLNGLTDAELQAIADALRGIDGDD